MWKKIKTFFARIINKFSKKRNKRKSEKNYLSRYIEIDIDVECSSYQQKIFNQTNEGDLLYCNMPMSDEELARIPEGHRTRPYYIAYKLTNGFIAYRCQSSRPRIHSNIGCYQMDNNKYTGINKISHICICDEIYLSKNKIIRYMFSLDNNDFNQINRRQYAINSDKFLYLYNAKPIIYKPILGDVVRYNKALWLIVDEIDNEYIAMYVEVGHTNNSGEKTYINCNLATYTVFINKKIKIPTKEGVVTHDIVDKNTINKILNLINKEETRWEYIDNGTILLCAGSLYYCYKINEYNMSAYKTLFVKPDINNYVLIKENEQDIYIDINKQYTITRSGKIKVLHYLSKTNIELINDIISPAKNINKKRKFYTEMPIGTVLRKKYEEEEYIYLFSNDECYFCIRAYEYLNQDIYDNYSMYSIGKSDTTKEGVITDEDLIQILSDQLRNGRDKNNILIKKYNEINVNPFHSADNMLEVKNRIADTNSETSSLKEHELIDID